MRKRYVRPLAGAAMLSIVLAACGSSSNKANNSSVPKGNNSTVPATTQGGVLTIGAEQEPGCVDWLSSCMDSSWGFWMAENATMPNSYLPIRQADGSYKNVPTDLLTGDAKFETKPVEKITYDINPKAVWSDGVPITCEDFRYTWQEIIGGKQILDPTGYTDIANVDCTKESEPVVTYKPGKTYGGWHQLFGGPYGIYPSHILKGKDRDATIKNGYSWSGGPFFMKWTRGDNMTLTPNPKYWGKQPKLDKIVFKFLTDTSAEFLAFKSNQVQAIYPQPTIDVVDAMTSGLSGINQIATPDTGAVEAIWYNSSHFPFNDKAVRKAIGYAIDRDAIVNQLFGKIGVKKAFNSLNPGVLADFSDQQAFSKYHLDLNQVNTIMTDGGWKKAGGFWTKNGKKAAFGISWNQGNKRRQLTVNALINVFKDAGFDMHPVSRTADQLFGDDLAKGNYDAGLFANQITSFTPGLCTSFCTKNIPTPQNGNTGNNIFRYSNPEADTQLELVDSSLDPATQMEAAKKADDILASDPPAIPLDPLPDILLWSKKVVGPIGDNAIYSMFYNMNEWGCVNGQCK